jgi:hypothetical protein
MNYHNSYSKISQQNITINFNLNIQNTIKYIKNSSYNNNIISSNFSSYNNTTLSASIQKTNQIITGNSIDALVNNIQPKSNLPVLYDNSQNFNNINCVYNQSNYLPKNKPQYDVVGQFLNPIRPKTQFINEAWQIQDCIKESFQTLMNKSFPDDIIVKVCDKETMKMICEQNNSKFKEGTLGFAINNKQINNNQNSQIFILQNNLDKMMLVIGHEIGHVLSHRLNNPHNEEAKAFAFELAWAKVIKENNIANLQDSINLNLKPARNGLHDVAFNFVANQIKKGNNALELFWMFIKNNLSVIENKNL